MLTEVEATIRRYGLLDAGHRVGVAVSGGADSMALLDVLSQLAARWDWRLTVIHVNHDLRGGESAGDQAFVEAEARRRGLPFLAERAPVPRDENLEQAARLSRLAFFRKIRDAGLVDRVATGHTRSDQAETVLFRLLRGSGTAGLAGIRPVTSGGVVRPLMEVSRRQVLEYLQQRQLAWRDDSSNHSLAYARNRIRHRWLPELSAENPSLEETLARTADWARDEEEYWEEVLRVPLAEVVSEPGGARIISIDLLSRLPKAAARRLLRAVIEQVKGDLRGLTLAHIDRLLTMSGLPEGHDRMQAPGIDVTRSFSWMRCARLEPAENRDFCISLPGAGRVSLPGGAALCLELVESRAEEDCVYNGEVGRLDSSRLAGFLSVRNWRPGDQYQPVGYAAEIKIKTLFQQSRVPLWERRSWPVVTWGETIVWSRRFGPAVRFAASPGSGRILKIWEQPEAEGCGAGGRPTGSTEGAQ